MRGGGVREHCPIFRRNEDVADAFQPTPTLRFGDKAMQRVSALRQAKTHLRKKLCFTEGEILRLSGGWGRRTDRGNERLFSPLKRETKEAADSTRQQSRVSQGHARRPHSLLTPPNAAISKSNSAIEAKATRHSVRPPSSKVQRQGSCKSDNFKKIKTLFPRETVRAEGGGERVHSKALESVHLSKRPLALNAIVFNPLLHLFSRVAYG